DEELPAVSNLRLCRCCRDRASVRDALRGRQRLVVLYVLDKQVERALRMWLDVLELRERVSECLDVVAVLHFVEPVSGAVVILVPVVVPMLGSRRRHLPRVGPRVMVDR